MNNIKCGASDNSLILTDIPIDALKAMRNSIDEAIRKYQEAEIDRYITDIQAAIDAARDAGYEVYINMMPYENADDIELYKNDEDENDDCNDEDDDPCFGCRDDCLHCPHC